MEENQPEMVKSGIGEKNEKVIDCMVTLAIVSLDDSL